MKILFVSPTVPSRFSTSGPAMIGYQLIKGLSQRHAITLLAFESGQEARARKFFSDLGVTVETVPTPHVSLLQHYFSSQRSIGWFLRRHESRAMLEKIMSADHGGQYDLIVVHSPFLATYVSADLRTPVVLNAIESLSRWFTQLSHSEHNVLKRWHLFNEARAAQRCEREIYPLARSVIVVSQEDREYLAQVAPEARVELIENGIDINEFTASAEQSDADSIVMTGAMDYPPNVAAVRYFYKKIWPQVIAAKPGVTWKIVGKNPAKEIMRIANRDSRITVTGAVPDIRPYLHRAALVVAPMTVATGRQTKVIEALACGKPLVATSISLTGISPQISRDLLVADTPNEFSRQIIFLLDHPEERARLGRSARQLAEQYPWDKTVAGHEQEYRHALE